MTLREVPMSATRGELFAGVTVAIVTPFKNGEIDWDGLGQLVDWHVAEGTDGLAPCGTTGESPTLDHDEHERVVAFVCERARGKLKIMAGTGSNSTREAIRMTKAAKKAGRTARCKSDRTTTSRRRKACTGTFARSPRRSICRSFCTRAQPHGGRPKHRNDAAAGTGAGIIGLKDATGDMPRAAELLKHLPPSFALYSGNDDSALALMLLGGHGVISVTANVAPRQMSEPCAAAFAGDLKRARRINAQLLPMHFNLFVEPNPVPVKWALARAGRINGGLGCRWCHSRNRTKPSCTVRYRNRMLEFVAGAGR